MYPLIIFYQLIKYHILLQFLATIYNLIDKSLIQKSVTNCRPQIVTWLKPSSHFTARNSHNIFKLCKIKYRWLKKRSCDHLLLCSKLVTLKRIQTAWVIYCLLSWGLVVIYLSFFSYLYGCLQSLNTQVKLV